MQIAPTRILFTSSITQIDRHTFCQVDRQTDIMLGRQTKQLCERYINTEIYVCRQLLRVYFLHQVLLYRQIDTHSFRQIDRQIFCQIDRQKGRYSVRQIDKQLCERYINIEIYVCRQLLRVYYLHQVLYRQIDRLSANR